MNKNSISVHLGDTNFTSSITNGKHRIMGDEPTDIGGQDQGMPHQNSLPVFPLPEISMPNSSSAYYKLPINARRTNY